MLSRAAERVYWTGRYLERAENSARLVQQYSQLLLDLPEEVGVDWAELVRIVGAADEFHASGIEENEADILHFLLAEGACPSALTYSLRMARENMRNTRDLLPQESWENINELYQDARTRIPLAARDENRFEVLSECIARCQQINGVLTGTMSHLSPYHFLMLGQGLERADMTSRIIDVATAYVSHNERLVRRYGSSLWTNVLKSVSAFQMYRQYCQPQVEGSKVISYLLRDTAFPRSVTWCLNSASHSIGRLPRGEELDDSMAAARAVMETSEDNVNSAEDVSRLMDTLQKRLADVHTTVAETWFLPGEG